MTVEIKPDLVKLNNNNKPNIGFRREYIVLSQFTNEVPDIPFPPKFINKRKNLKKFIEYNNNFDIRHNNLLIGDFQNISSENRRSHEYVIHEKLEKERKRSLLHAVKLNAIPQFYPRKSSTNLSTSARSPRVEDDYHWPVEKQIKAIENSFKNARNIRKKIAHPHKKGVTAVSVSKVLPDFKHFGYSLVPVDFHPYPELPNVRKEFKKMSLVHSHIGKLNGEYGHFIPSTAAIISIQAEMKGDSDDEEPIGKNYAYSMDRSYSLLKLETHNEYYLRTTSEGTFYAPLACEKQIYKPLRKLGNKEEATLCLTIREQNAKEIKEFNNNMDRLLKKSERLAIERSVNCAELTQTNNGESDRSEVDQEMPDSKIELPIKKSKIREEEQMEDLYSSEESSDESSSDEYQPPPKAQPEKKQLTTKTYYGPLDKSPVKSHSNIKIKEEPISEEEN